MRIIRNLLTILFLTATMLASSMIVLPTKSYAAVPAGCDGSVIGLPTWYKYLDLSDAPACTVEGPTDPVNGGIDWAKASGLIAVALIEAMLRIASLVAVGFVIYGGFRFIVSQGEPDNAKAARETVINALIGLAITIVAASVVSFITTRLTS